MTRSPVQHRRLNNNKGLVNSNFIILLRPIRRLILTFQGMMLMRPTSSLRVTKQVIGAAVLQDRDLRHVPRRKALNRRVN